MRESSVEGYLLALVADRRGVCIKQSPMGDNGWPDRLVLLPGGVMGFLELKRPGKEPEPLQLHRIARLCELGYTAGWANTLAGVRAFVLQLDGFTARTAALNQAADRLAR